MVELQILNSNIYNTDGPIVGMGKSHVVAKGRHRGFPFVIISCRGSHPCSYVGIPRSHRMFGKGYDEVDVECHGGFTYAEGSISGGMLPEEFCGVGWWLGWDYAHLNDFTGGLRETGGHIWSVDSLVSEIKSVIDSISRRGRWRGCPSRGKKKRTPRRRSRFELLEVMP